MAREMVLAYGDNGLEMTSARDTVEIPVLGKTITPAVKRHLLRGRGGVPIRLLRVESPNARNGLPHVYVRYECTPFPRWTEANASVLGYESGCQVRSEVDMQDPHFDNFSTREKQRIVRAVRKAVGTID